MNSEGALDFLRRHQPLPDDDVLDEETIGKFDDVRKYFREHPDPRCVPLLLGSFGDGDGFGVYQIVDDALRRQPREIVIQGLKEALRSEHRSVRYWCAHLSVVFSDERLIQELADLLKEEDFDIKPSDRGRLEIKSMALSALGIIGIEAQSKATRDVIINIITRFEEIENDPELLDDVKIILDEILDSGDT
jgi:HEAT repeat protein